MRCTYARWKCGAVTICSMAGSLFGLVPPIFFHNKKRAKRQPVLRHIFKFVVVIHERASNTAYGRDTEQNRLLAVVLSRYPVNSAQAVEGCLQGMCTFASCLVLEAGLATAAGRLLVGAAFWQSWACLATRQHAQVARWWHPGAALRKRKGELVFALECDGLYCNWL